SDYQLWRTDGTNTFAIFHGSVGINTLTSVSGITFFSVNDNELWKTDGTIAGTVMVKKFPFEIERFTTYRGLLFFVSSDNTTYNGLWRSDGTTEGTFKVSSKLTYISQIFSFDDLLFVVVIEGFYKSNGTDEGTVL